MNTGYWNKDVVFYCFCMKCHVLKLKCDVFALHCVTKLLFAFIWDIVVPQIHRVQRPVEQMGTKVVMIQKAITQSVLVGFR